MGLRSQWWHREHWQCPCYSSFQSAPLRDAEMVVERKEKGKQADENTKGELTDVSVIDAVLLIANWYLGWEGKGRLQQLNIYIYIY